MITVCVGELTGSIWVVDHGHLAIHLDDQLGLPVKLPGIVKEMLQYLHKYRQYVLTTCKDYFSMP